MAKIDTKGIDDEDRNERKAKGFIHFRLKGMDFSAAL
jgi:hypothetical protein